MKVKKSDIAGILTATFPEYKGRKFFVTACERCNKSRGARSVAAFARATAEYLNHGAAPQEIVAQIRACVRRSLAPHKTEAKAMIARRGSVARVLATKTRRA